MPVSAPVAALAVGLGVGVVAQWRRRRVMGRLRPVEPRPLVRAPRRLTRALEAADFTADPDQIATLWVGALGVSFGAVLVLGPPGMVVLVVAAIGPVVVLGLRQDRRNDRRRAELPAFAEATASAVRGGASLPSALGAARASTTGPLDVEVSRLAAELDRGLPVADTFAPWAADPDPDVRLVGQAISLVAAHGGRAGQALERTAAVLRSRDDLHRERLGMATQARASAVVMTAAPVAFAVVSGMADPRTFRFLFTTPLGIACLVAGTTLDLAGARWMASIVRRAT
jgi:tight adherence protein B